jgi:Filamin/ABP280 repeat
MTRPTTTLRMTSCSSLQVALVARSVLLVCFLLPLSFGASGLSTKAAARTLDVANIGPIDPEKCTIGGSGYTGGAACTTTSFFVTAKDSAGKRIKEGGAHVTVKVTPLGLTSSSAEPVEDVSVNDNEDGTYTCTYSVPARGNYEVGPHAQLQPNR